MFEGFESDNIKNFKDRRKHFIENLKKDVEQYRNYFDADPMKKAELDWKAFIKDGENIRKAWRDIGKDFPIR